METKYELNGYNLHVIKNSNFKTVSIRVNFKRKCIKDELSIRYLLSNILMESNGLYKTTRELEIKTEDLYDLRYSSYNTLSGIFNIMTFQAVFLDEKYTEKNMLYESIKFLCNLILNPNAKDEFDLNSFNICKMALKEQIETLKEDPSSYSKVRLLEEMDKKSVSSYRVFGYMKDLKKITPKSLYDYYKSVIENDMIDIFVIGNVDEVMIKEMFNDLFIVKTKPYIKESHYILNDKIRKNVKIVKEEMETSQSNLLLGFKLKDLTYFEKQYVIPVYNFILGGSADSKLFKNVREKNSLCYTINSHYLLTNDLLLIYSGINKENYDKSVKLIKEQLKEIESGNISEENIISAKETYKSAFTEINDNQLSILNNYISREYLDLPLSNVRMEKINEVTKEMVIDVSKKIHLDTIYLLEGIHED